ncbi:hypothetical protein Tco_0739199 [Tanacetum coccineum]
MPILHSFKENKLEYKDEDEVKIKMMGTGMDKESLKHNLYKDNMTPIICHNFSPTSNPPIKPKDLGNFRMKVVKPLTIHTPPSPNMAYFHQNDQQGTDISKITRKQSKNGQARARESEENKKKPEKSSLKLAQHVTSKNDMLAIHRCPQINPMAQDQYLIIEGIDG